MAICPVCGCKTDELDFVKGSVNGVEKDICSFCDRQLKTFGTEDVPLTAVRWLQNVMGKDVQRDEDVQSALQGLYDKHGKMPVPPVQNQNPVPQQAVGAKISSSDFDDKDKIIAQLVKRVEKLEKDLVQMKRKQMIKTIVELGVPVVMLILLIIIFFASGLPQYFGQIMDMAGITI